MLGRPDRPLRLLLVHDPFPLSWRIRTLIQEALPVEIVGETSSPPVALDLLRERAPDAVLLDLDTGGGAAALPLLGEMKRACPRTAVVVITSLSIPTYRKRCTELGADFFFDKFQEMERVPEVLLEIRSGLPEKTI